MTIDDRRRRWGRGACLSLVALVLVGAAAGSVLAAEDLTADELGLEVEVGFEGQAVRRAWLPVSILLEPDHAFRGQLRILVDHGGGHQVAVQDVEVPAGSAKVFRFVIPPSHNVEVQAVAGDGRGLRIPVAARGQTDDYLVGLLGADVPANAPPLRADAFDMSGTYVPVDPAWLEHPSSLHSLSALVADPTTLEALGDAQRRVLSSEVTAGLDLVVIADGPGSVELADLGLPGPARDVRPDPQVVDALAVEPADGAWSLLAGDVVAGEPSIPVAAAAPAGLGRVVVSGAALGTGEIGSHGDYWGLLLQPTPRSGGTVTSDGMEQLLANVGEGLRSGQLELPPIGWFAVFLAAYVVIVGPVNALVLARVGRRELAWLTVPAVTAVFALGAWVTSADQSPSLGLAGRAAYWVDGGGSEVAVAALRAPRAEDHTVVVEGGDWAVLTGTWSAPASVMTLPDDVRIDLRLEALQVGTVIAQRPTGAEAPLAVDARIVGTTVEVEVTNRTAEVLDDLSVRAGTAEDDLPSLAPGQTRTHSFDAGDTLPVDQAWHDPFAGLRAPDGSVEAPRSLEALLRFSVLDGNPGLVWVTATLPPGSGGPVPVHVGGAPAADQGHFVAVGTTPDQTDADLSPFEVRRALLTTGFGSAHQPGPLAIEGQTEAVLRYRIPAGGELDQLTSTLERGQLAQGGGRFHTCEVTEVPGDENRMREVCGPEPVIDVVQEVCPPEAAHCAVEEGGMFVCTDAGPCGVEPMPPQLLDAMAAADLDASGLEIYDRDAKQWRPVGEVFGPGDGTVDDPAPYVSPLGDVLVRVSGEFFPFDFSGRGLGGRFAS